MELSKPTEFPLRNYAAQRISLYLDVGVKVNYGKFGNLLAEVKAVTGDELETCAIGMFILSGAVSVIRGAHHIMSLGQCLAGFLPHDDLCTI